MYGESSGEFGSRHVGHLVGHRLWMDVTQKSILRKSLFNRI